MIPIALNVVAVFLAAASGSGIALVTCVALLAMTALLSFATAGRP